jgi:type VI secretion system protein
MSLVLHLDSNDPALRDVAGRRVEVASRMTIGRGSDNDLVLPDPNRHLSKNHCTIAFDGRAYTITDTSTNGVFLNNNPERLPRGVPTPLGEGSVMRLGDYTMTIAAITPPGASVPPMAPVQPSASPDDGLFGDPLGGADPFAAPEPFPRHSPPAQGHGLPAQASGDDDMFGFATGASPAAGPVIPDDVDLFGDNRPAEPWQGASQPDHAPSSQAFFAPPKASVETIPDDWDLADLGVPLGTPAPIAPAPGRAAAAQPSLPVDEGFAEGTNPPARRPAAATGAPPPGDDAAIASFLAAVGLGGTALSDAEKSAVMRLAGEALAVTVKGLTEILAARSTTKQEFRIERTTIGAMGNNPLKFSASLDEAMRVMLLGRIPGFLSAKQAIEEALGDVKSHQLAVLAGMQVALTTVIARFDPAKLEKRIEQSSLIEGILPAARKARYWELFKTLYKELATELEDDFQSLFGAEFARAYKDQIDKL